MCHLITSPASRQLGPPFFWPRPGVGRVRGALIVRVLLNGRTLMAASPEAKFIARGTVLAVAVWLGVRYSRQKHAARVFPEESALKKSCRKRRAGV
jgi:hypothetical protein